MIKEITKIKTLAEMDEIFTDQSVKTFFSDNEIESVKDKNQMKSLGARYLIKKSILDYFQLDDDYRDIEIKYGTNGKPELYLHGELKKKIQQNIQISLSHSRNFISTLVVIE
jgi:holo-[acyl-carrier-protein] synthase